MSNNKKIKEKLLYQDVFLYLTERSYTVWMQTRNGLSAEKQPIYGNYDAARRQTVGF